MRGFIREDVLPLFRDKPWHVVFTFHDAFVLIALATTSLVIRFHCFWRPIAPALDEGAASPLSPLFRLMFWVFDGLSRCDDDGERLLALRWAAIAFSSLVPAVWYICVRLASFSRIAATSAASLVLFDTSILCAERLALVDGLYHLLACISISSLMYWCSLRRNTSEWRVWMRISACLIGVTATAKLPALLILGVVIFHEGIAILVDCDGRLGLWWLGIFVSRIGEVLRTTLAAYLVVWGIGEWALMEVDADAVRALYESPWNATFTRKTRNFVEEVVKLHIESYRPRASMSKALDWPFMTGIAAPVYDGVEKHVRIIGNFFVYLIVFASVLMVMFKFHRRLYFRAAKFVVGYLVMYVPFIFTNRTISQLEYCVPLMFGAACYGIMMDFWMGGQVKGAFCIVTIAIVAFGFFEWAPMVYARHITAHEYSARMWFKMWVSGRGNRDAWLAERNATFAKLLH